MTMQDVACWAVKRSLRSKLYLKFVFKISFITGCRADLLVKILPPLRSLKMTMQDVAPKGQKSTGRGVSPCERADSEQSAEGATDAIILSPFQGCHAGCLLLQGLHPCLCSDTPSGHLFRGVSRAMRSLTSKDPTRDRQEMRHGTRLSCHSEGAKRRKNLRPTQSIASEILPIRGVFLRGVSLAMRSLTSKDPTASQVLRE